MKFVCDGLSLSEAVIKVSKACAVRTTAPVMECIKLSAFGEEVTLLATDGELSIRKSVKAEIFEEGEVCVPGKLFSDFIGKLSGEEVSIATGEKGVEIRYRDAGTFMQSLPAEEFPKIDFSVGENSFTMGQAALKKIIAETVFCCAQDDSRPVLKGCLMEFGDKLEMTGNAMELMAYLSHTSVGEQMYNVTLQEKVSRDEASKEMLGITYEDIIFDLNGIHNFGNSGNTLRSCAIGREENFLSKYASLKPKAEAELDKLIEQYNSIE